ncbi:MAG: molybdopterin-binding protein [Myxococcota bacterium]|nr:molybdopterin-binding protein [Myxococcota bacterium]
MLTVSIIIIGDEILSAKFTDENTPFLLSQCSELGVTVRTVRIISDKLSEITAAVSEEASRSDYVFTTGGVGTTHDDRTLKGIAMAFGESLVRNSTLENIIRSKMADRLTEAALRMSDVPESTILWDTKDGFFPQIVVHNVIVFPGVPYILKKKFNAIKERFRQSAFIVEKLFLNVRESAIADTLSNIQDNHPNVQIGSYPRHNEGSVKLIFTVQSKAQDAVSACSEELRKAFSNYLLPNPEEESISDS